MSVFHLPKVDILIELDNTALDISCRIHTQKSKEGENKMVDTESKGESESENIMATEGEINRKSTKNKLSQLIFRLPNSTIQRSVREVKRLMPNGDCSIN